MISDAKYQKRIKFVKQLVSESVTQTVGILFEVECTEDCLIKKILDKLIEIFPQRVKSAMKIFEEGV